MKKYPFVKQNGLKDCGPASLEMIINYYGGHINIIKLTELLRTTKDGTTAYDIVMIANKLGLNAKGLRLDNLNNIKLPSIAFVTINNSYNHYIVIYEIDYIKKQLLIADPNDKIKKISFEEFFKIWNKVIITFEKTKKLPVENQIKPLTFIYKLIKKYKYKFIIITILSAVIMFLSVTTSLIFKTIFDNLSKNTSFIFQIIAIFIVIHLVKIMITFIRNKILAKLNNLLDYDLTTNTFQKTIFLPYHYYHNHTTGEVVSKIFDLNKVKDIISELILTTLLDVPLVLLSILIFIKINKLLGVIIFILTLSYIIVYKLISKPIKNYLEILKNDKANVTEYMFENISGFETIKGISCEDKVINKFNEKYQKYLKGYFKLNNYFNYNNLIKDLIYGTGQILIILIGVLNYKNGTITIGSIISFNALFIYYMEPIRNIVDVSLNFKDAKNALNRILDLYDYNKYCGKVSKILDGNIKINNLSYGFDDDLILKNIDLEIPIGTKVMVVGASGSGKSTLFKLLKGYYETNNIKIDNIDIGDYQKDALNDIIYISQNETLFTDTIINNLKISDNDDNFEIITKLCYIDDIISKKEHGLNCLIEENGFNLSGGEKQRLILARALLNKFKILIIDEGLSQIDTNLERKILKNIFKEYPSLTIIVISHRLDNRDLYDMFIEINDGQVIKSIRKES